MSSLNVLLRVLRKLNGVAACFGLCLQTSMYASVEVWGRLLSMDPRALLNNVEHKLSIRGSKHPVFVFVFAVLLSLLA